MSRAAVLAAALLSLTLSGACRAGDAMPQDNPPGADQGAGQNAASADIGEIGFGLWRVEGAAGRCLISLSKSPAGPGALMVVPEGCDGHALRAAKRWRVASGDVQIVDDQDRELARLRHQGPDVLTGQGLRLTRAPEA